MLCLYHIYARVFGILFIDYHAQVKTNLTHKQEPHAGDVYLGHEGCLHHLVLQEAGKHSNTKHAN